MRPSPVRRTRYNMAINRKKHRSGGPSVPIRTDRGGWVTANGGTCTSSGLGSPANYSMAVVKVTGATLVSNHSEGVCIERTGSRNCPDNCGFCI